MDGELASLQERVDKVAAEVRQLVVVFVDVLDGVAVGQQPHLQCAHDCLPPGRRSALAGTRGGAPVAGLRMGPAQRAATSSDASSPSLWPRLCSPPQAGKEKEAVVALLKQLAPLYNRLYDAAKAALVPLPGAHYRLHLAAAAARGMPPQRPWCPCADTLACLPPVASPSRSAP